MKVLMDDAVLESLLPVSPAFQQVYRVRGASDGKEGGGREVRGMKKYRRRQRESCGDTVTGTERVMAEREQERKLERFYSLKRGAQQGEMALIRALR